MWFLGIVLALGTPLGVAVHESPDWGQGWLLDIPVGWLMIAAVLSCILALTEVS